MQTGIESSQMTLVVPPASLDTAYRSFLDTLPVRRPARLLFVNIPQVPADIFSPGTARLNGYHIYPPIGYLYLAAAARQVDPGMPIQILDLNYEMLKACHLDTLPADPAGFWKPLLKEHIGTGDGLHVCIGNMFEATTPMFLEITKHVREEYPQVTVVAGGVQTTMEYREVLDADRCHLVLRHEAEGAFAQFLRNCTDRSADLPEGLAFRYGGQLHETGAPKGVSEFLDLREQYDLIDIENYYQYGGVNPYSRYAGKERAFSTVLANRGCRADCSFCGVRGFNGVGVRRRTARHIVDEIKYLVEHKGIRLIEWLDDDLLYGRKESAELFKLMAQELPSDFRWIANNGVIAGAVNDEIMEWMAKSGCLAFKVGIESGNDAMLRKIRKPATKPGLRKAGEIFKKYPEVFVSANFIVGFPGETVGEMLDSYDFAIELGWDWANYYICQPLPGTDIFDAFASMGDTRCDNTNFGVYNPGKSAAQKGNFGYYKGYHTEDEAANAIKSGRDVFNLAKDVVPSLEQIKEIWFTFNMVSNFLENTNFKPGGNVPKIARWFESIAASYPRDAGMCAMLAYSYKQMGDEARASVWRGKFDALAGEFEYWQRRLEEFPELVEFAAGRYPL
jgi:tRNA A37 methylthiotransferase MiaB